jgi:Flp pilus assembly protein TadD
MRLGILDAAHEQLTAAVKRDPRDASSWDLLARIWRDWGLPHLGLPDAQRARYFAPTSAVVHNTAGTLLQALGRRQAAREEFERAIALDPNAAYAHSNLCYSLLIQRHDAEAVRECERAVALAPDFGPARNNLALAYAAVGQLDRAAQTFKGDSDPARAQFNLGLVRFARHDYTGAVDAFVAAQQLRPDFARARTLARQAHDYQQRGDD